MRLRRTAPARLARARPRLLVAIGLAVLTALVLPHDWRASTRLLLAWNVGCGLYFALTALMIVGATAQSIRRQAERTDEGKFAILVLTVLGAGAAFGAIVAELGATKDMPDKGLHIILAAVTVLSAWTLIHLIFALHYAHEYFDEVAAVSDAGAATHRGGLLFPGEDEPDYLDFLYFAFVIGVAAQTADVATTSKFMRRTALVHCVIAFLFNSALLALTINIAASLI